MTPEPLMDTPIIVDVVDVGEETNAPPPKVAPDPKPEPPKKAPPPPPKAAAPPPPAPEEVAVVPPEPAPKAIKAAKLKPKPKPVPKVKAKPKVRNVLARAKPRKKPRPPDLFASVLRTVEKLAPQAPVKEPDKKQKKSKPEADFNAMMASALSSTPQRFNPSQRVTISEIDLVRRQIEKCWSPPAGAKDAQSLKTTIRVWMNVDGKVRKAELADVSQVSSNPFHRAVAESALRAVLNRKCQPFKLPPDKYSEWSTINLTFDPKDMF
jgi:outer membrane biosynthesis protein TonB